MLKTVLVLLTLLLCSQSSAEGCVGYFDEARPQYRASWRQTMEVRGQEVTYNGKANERDGGSVSVELTISSKTGDIRIFLENVEGEDVLLRGFHISNENVQTKDLDNGNTLYSGLSLTENLTKQLEPDNLGGGYQQSYIKILVDKNKRLLQFEVEPVRSNFENETLYVEKNGHKFYSVDDNWQFNQ